MTLSESPVKNCDSYMATGACVDSEKTSVSVHSNLTIACYLLTMHIQSQHIFSVTFAPISCSNFEKNNKKQSLYISFIFLIEHLYEQTVCLLFTAEAAYQNYVFFYRLFILRQKMFIFRSPNSPLCWKVLFIKIV